MEIRTILKQTWISAFDTGNVVYAISVGLPKIYQFHAKDNYLNYLLTDHGFFQVSFFLKRNLQVNAYLFIYLLISFFFFTM